MTFSIQKSKLQGKIQIPPSKSHTLRAIYFASFSFGKSTIRNYLPSPDTEAMINACRSFGAEIVQTPSELLITGTSGCFKTPSHVIDVGNSGITLRFMTATAALLPSFTTITGDLSVQTQRNMEPLLGALVQGGAVAESSLGNGRAPLRVRGPVHPSTFYLDGQDSQPVSALLMLTSFLEGKSTVFVKNPGEKPWIDLTLHWLTQMGAKVEHENYHTYTVHGPSLYKGFEYTVPGDWSLAAFPMVAALITGSELILQNLDLNDPQGDRAVLDLLTQMGARFEFMPEQKWVKILKSSSQLKGISYDINHVIDALPILAVAACFADGPTQITGAAIARHKECDRIKSIARQLQKMGAHVVEYPDGLTIFPTPLYGAYVQSDRDHRICMALAVAGMQVGDTFVQETNCIAKTFYNFVSSFQGCGAHITEISKK